MGRQTLLNLLDLSWATRVENNENMIHRVGRHDGMILLIGSLRTERVPLHVVTWMCGRGPSREMPE